MGLEVVIGEIREKGQKEAAQIRQETQKESHNILRAAQEKAGRIKIAADQEVERQTAHLINQDISAANLIVKRQQLNTQKDLLDQVYKNALEKISQMPQEFHRQAMKYLLARAQREIPEGIVHCSRRDSETLAQILAGNPVYKQYRAGNPVEIDGGVILESTNGELQIDYSYRTLLNQIWETRLKDASELLFS